MNRFRLKARDKMSDTSGILEKKWRKFLRYRWLFAFAPFLDFVIAAGSLAFGKVHENSDFDVIVGVRPGRIFTVRFFCFLLFGFFGVRRDKLDHDEALRDKICFNHFVAPAGYKLRPPYNIYWEKLYQNLAPVYGRKTAVQDFFKANEFLTKGAVHSFEKFAEAKFNFFRVLCESIFGGPFGDFFEKSLKKIQISRIGKALKIYGTGFSPRLRFDDDELEFHPDTARIGKIIEELQSK